MDTRHYRTGIPLEDLYGYSQGVRKGHSVFVAGTRAVEPPHHPVPPTTPITVLYPDSAYKQAVYIFKAIIDTVEHLGGKHTDIMRVRICVRNGADGDAVGTALKDVLGKDVQPTASMTFNYGFVHPDIRVEVEADAVIF